MIWSWIYDPTFGVLNSTLKTLGVIHNYQLWIGTHQLQTIFFISLVQVWQITPLAAILVLASLQAIPSELYEAADVDGANNWQSIKRITLPLIRPALAIAVVEGLVMSLNIFDQVYVLNAGATTGSSLMSETYQITFGNLNFGRGLRAVAAGDRDHDRAVAARGEGHLPQGGVLMTTATAELTLQGRRSRKRFGWLRGIGIGVLLLWSLFPVYWALNTSLQTNAQATEQPADLVPDALRVQQLRGDLRDRPVERLDRRRRRPGAAQLLDREPGRDAADAGDRRGRRLRVRAAALPSARRSSSRSCWRR